MLKNWLKLYIAFINKSKYFFLWNILGLSIGITSVVLAIIHYQDEYAYNRWIPTVDQIYEVNIDIGSDANSIYVPAAIGPELFQNEFIENYCYFALEYIEFYTESDSYKGVQGGILNTQKTFFDFFPFDFLYGNKNDIFKEEYSIAISEEVSKRYFGESNPIGHKLSLAHQSYIVKGVYKTDKNATIRPHIVIANIEWNNQVSPLLWQENIGGLLIKKRPTTVLDQLADLIASSYKTNKRINKFFEEGEEVNINLTSLKEGRFTSKQTSLLEGRIKLETLRLIIACSILIFVLSIVNYISLNQASILSRARELTIRKIVGANKWQMIFQILFETMLTVCLALLLSFVFIEISLPVYNQFLYKSLVFSLSFGLLISLILGIIIILLGGVVPALYANYVANKTLENRLNMPVANSFKRYMILVIVQMIIAFFFMIASFVIHEQVQYIKKQPLGFEQEEVLQIKLYTQSIKRKLYRGTKVIDYLKQIQGVEGVALSTLSFKDKTITSNRTAYYGQQQINDFVFEGIDSEYIDLLGFKILAEELNIPAELSTVIVNKQFINKLGLSAEEVRGQVISYDGNTYVIQAVIDDFFNNGFEQRIKPTILFDWRDIDFLPYTIESLSIKIDEKQKEETLERVRAFWIVNIDIEYPFEASTIKEQIAQTYERVVAQRNMFLLWNIAVVLITLFGVYATMSFILEQKLKSLVIRKILGATTQSLLVQLILPFVITIMIAFLIAVIPTYLLLDNWLQRFYYRQELTVVLFIISLLWILLIVVMLLVKKVLSALNFRIINYIKRE